MIHKTAISLAAAAAVSMNVVAADNVITVAAVEGDATAALQQAIDDAAGYKGKSVIIRLSPGNYEISREKSSRHLYHISN
ncbi:MAG: hypothetical protein K2G92_08990, partial [Duncaniella sp.]|nr:hypothetical protein [Duncaniella sp.]